jgi:hypothetical protein
VSWYEPLSSVRVSTLTCQGPFLISFVHRSGPVSTNRMYVPFSADFAPLISSTPLSVPRSSSAADADELGVAVGVEVLSSDAALVGAESSPSPRVRAYPMPPATITGTTAATMRRLRAINSYLSVSCPPGTEQADSSSAHQAGQSYRTVIDAKRPDGHRGVPKSCVQYRP